MKQPNLIKSLTYMLSSSGFELAISVVITIALAKLLGPKDLGILLSAEAFVELFNLFFRTGFRNSILQFAAHDERGFLAGLNKASTTALLLKIMILIPASFIIYFVAIKTQCDATLVKVIVIYILIYGLESIASVFGITRKALGQFKLISFIIGLNRVIRLVVIFGVLVYLKGDLTMLVWAFLIERVITTIFSALSTLRLFKIEVDLSQLKPMFKDSLGFGILDSLDGIQGRIDRVMLQSLIGPTAVAFYAIPAKLNRNTQMVLKSITQVFLPSMHDSIINNPPYFKTITQHLSRFLAVSGTFVFILVYFYSEDILFKVFGAEYSGSLYIAKLFAFVNLMWFLQKTPDLILMTQAAHGKRLWGQIIGISTNVGANYILITKYGLDGAVYATMLANLVTLIFSASFCHRYLEVGRCIAIIIVPVIAVFFLPIYYLVIFYVAYLFIAKLVNKEDITSIINAFRNKEEVVSSS